MKNHQLISLVNAGILSATVHTLCTADSYKVFKLKKAIRTAFTGIQDMERDLLAECGITDPKAFDNRTAELRSIAEPSEAEKSELEGMEAKSAQFFEQRTQLYNEEAELKDVRTIPYESWKQLQDENAAVAQADGRKTDIFSGLAEELLEGIFWIAPEEGE